MTDVLTRRIQSPSFGAQILTWNDLICMTADWAGARNAGLTNRMIRQGTMEAYNDFCGIRHWNFLNVAYSITLAAKVELSGYYDHTGNGSGERVFVVTTGTLPSWTAVGSVRLGNAYYEVEAQPDSTHIQFSVSTNPGRDIGSVSDVQSATLYRTAYMAPADYVSSAEPQPEQQYGCVYLPPDEFYSMERRAKVSGTPQYWTVAPHPRYLATQALKFFPLVASESTVGIYYRRWFQKLRVSGLEGTDFGLGTISSSSNANRVTVPAGKALSHFPGAIFRIRSDTNMPEGAHGTYPYEFEAAIISVDTGNNYLYLDRDTPTTFTNKQYVVSSPLDVPPVCHNALVQGARFFYANHGSKELRDMNVAKSLYDRACEIAAENDSPASMMSRMADGNLYMEEAPASRPWW